MIQVQVNDHHIEAGVLGLAKDLPISTEDVIRRALDQMLEDGDDSLAGTRAFNGMKYTISAKEMKRLPALAA